MKTDEKWAELADKWMYYLPPHRPSTSDLMTIRAVVNTRFPPGYRVRALVLGATPEYRDLLCAIGALSTVVDKNPDMIRAMNYLRGYDTAETVVVADWFDYLPTCEHSFDLILSDYTQGNIEYRRHRHFYHLISRALVPGGILIDRVVTYRDPAKLYETVGEFESFSQCPINLITLNDMLVKCFFATDLVYKWKRVNTRRIFALLETKSQSPILKKFIEMMKKHIVSDAIVWYYGKDWDLVAESYFHDLQLVREIPHTGSAYEGFVFIIVSTPK